MTAPDTRDSVELVVAEMHDTNTSVMLGGSADYPQNLIAEWAHRLQALARGPHLYSEAASAVETGVDDANERQPDGYAYRYADGFIRHNGGRDHNGMRPTETIPFYYGSAPALTRQPVAGDGWRAIVYAALRSIRYNANNGSQDRPPHQRLHLIAAEAERAIACMEASYSVPTGPAQGDG